MKELTELPKRCPVNGTFELTIRCNLHCKMCLFRHADCENATLQQNELTTEHFNTRYYDEEKGFDYTIEIETFYIVDYTQKNGVVCKDVKMNRLTYLANKALDTPMTVKEQWKEIVKHYIYD